MDGLKVRPLPGAAPKLTDRQSSQLRGQLAGRDPRQFQFDFALWSRKIVRDLIRQQFGVDMTPQGAAGRREVAAPTGVVAAAAAVPRAYQQDPEGCGATRRMTCTASSRSGTSTWIWASQMRRVLTATMATAATTPPTAATIGRAARPCDRGVVRGRAGDPPPR